MLQSVAVLAIVAAAIGEKVAAFALALAVGIATLVSLTVGETRLALAMSLLLCVPLALVGLRMRMGKFYVPNILSWYRTSGWGMGASDSSPDWLIVVCRMLCPLSYFWILFARK